MLRIGARPDLVEVRYDAGDRGGELDLALATFDGVFGDGGLEKGLLIEVAIQPCRATRSKPEVA